MSRWRITVVAILTMVPFLALAGVGSYYLWTTGVGFYVWWGMFACLSLGYFLGWYWQHKLQLLHALPFKPPLHWTERDQQAWQQVEARARGAVQIDPARFTELDFYVETAKEMALELARFYHPNAQDPLAHLTMPEILAVIELAAHDLAEMVDQYVPGSHLLTLRDWRLARQAVDWYQSASKIYWLISALFSPIETGARFAASKFGLSRSWEMFQQNILLWFYTAYVHRTGTYLVDLYSGRLHIGAHRYRELVRERMPAHSPPAASAVDAADQVQQVTITLLGQVKVGKSSLINALLGEQRAQTDVLPATATITRYELQPEGIPTRLVLLDTVGYAHTGPVVDQIRATQKAARQSDALLLVLHARNPAREADRLMLRELSAWFAAHPDLKMPPIVGVLTHIDLLTPALEWSPPYDWEEPQRLKEQQVAQAVLTVREQLGELLIGVVPVCTAAGKVYGIEEYLLPVLSKLLDEARAVALLRCLRAEIDTGKVRKVFQQFLAAGTHLAKLVWRNLAPQPPNPPREHPPAG